jgi:hypothetical protein
MIEVGTYFRTTRSGEFKAGGAIVRVDEIGPDWILARDKNGKPYVAYINPEFMEWNSFIVPGFFKP